MKRFASALGLALVAVFTTGCFDIEQTLTLERNLSGQAGFSMKIDMEPMAYFMAQMERQFSGKTGEPSAADVAKARAELVKSSKPKPTDFEAEKREMASKLPKGVTLKDATFSESELAVAVGLLFGFDHPSKLAAIKLSDNKTSAKAGQPGENPIDAPFADLKVVDEGATILITGPPQNPLESAKDEAPPTPEAEKMIAQLMKNLRVVFKIAAPFQVVTHNAHRREGTTLIWQYDLKSLESLTPQQLSESIKVRYRK